MLTELPCKIDEVENFLSQPSDAVVELVKSLPAGPIMVLGAGGKIGLHLSLMLKMASDAAKEADRRIIAVSRFSNLRGREEFESAGIETIPCDLSVQENLDALPDAPTIFFLAGVKFGTASDPGLLKLMNVTMPQLVAKRFKDSRIVAFSTGCVYPFAEVNSKGSTENTPPEPPGDYAMSCREREQAFEEVSRQYGTKVVLIRLNYSVEFRYGVLVDIAQKVLHEEPLDLTMGHVNVIWQRDAVAQIIQSVSHAASPAVPLNITGANVLKVRNLANDFAKLFGKEPKFIGVEADTAWLNDASLSHKLYGLPETSVATMEKWIAAWLSSNGETWNKPTGFEKRSGKF